LKASGADLGGANRGTCPKVLDGERQIVGITKGEGSIILYFVPGKKYTKSGTGRRQCKTITGVNFLL